MPPYEVYLHASLLGSMPKSGMQRQMILQFLRRLREQPGSLGDFAERDSSLREPQIKVIGKFAVTFWPDHAARSVMVVNIRLADE